MAAGGKDLEYTGRWGVYKRTASDNLHHKFKSQISRKYRFMQGYDEKEKKIIEMRRSGMTFTGIAAALGYANASGPATVFKNIMEKEYAATRESIDAFRQEEVERLDHQLQILLTGQVKSPDNLNYVDKIVKVLERKAKLLGLDAAIKTESTVNMNLSHEDALELLDNLDRTQNADDKQS